MSSEVYERPNRSIFLGNLALALSKAQGQMEGAAKANSNPFFKSKYADLAAVWDACREPLSVNELAVVQTVDDAELNGRIVVETMLIHSSGEWISGRIGMRPVKDDPQGVGSVITYARRYGLQAIVGIAPEDDDGNAASGNGGRKAPSNVPVTDRDIDIGGEGNSASGGASSTLPPASERVTRAGEPASSVKTSDNQRQTGQRPEAPGTRQEGRPTAGTNGGRVTPSRTAEVASGPAASAPPPQEIEYCTRQQQDFLRLKFEEKVGVKYTTHADQFRRDWLKTQGYVTDKGVGTSVKIPRHVFNAVCADALKEAEAIRLLGEK